MNRRGGGSEEGVKHECRRKGRGQICMQERGNDSNKMQKMKGKSRKDRGSENLMQKWRKCQDRGKVKKGTRGR